MIWLGALFLAALVPWNIALWWQVRRLRLAIEFDCDARTLRTGMSEDAYENTLLWVAQRRSKRSFGGIGVLEPRLQIEKRIHAILRAEGPGTVVVLLAGCVAALVLCAAAAQLRAPSVQPASPEYRLSGRLENRHYARLRALIVERYPEVFAGPAGMAPLLSWSR
jgi:bla regulator protein blaR1